MGAPGTRPPCRFRHDTCRVIGRPADNAADDRKDNIMGYGIGGILVLILVILAIIYFAKRV